MIESEETLFFICPHENCQFQILVYKNEINCGIFRNAVYKDSNLPVNPHASKLECETLVQLNLVVGCCHPFQILRHNNTYSVQVCDYV